MNSQFNMLCFIAVACAACVNRSLPPWDIQPIKKVADSYVETNLDGSNAVVDILVWVSTVDDNLLHSDQVILWMTYNTPRGRRWALGTAFRHPREQSVWNIYYKWPYGYLGVYEGLEEYSHPPTIEDTKSFLRQWFVSDPRLSEKILASGADSVMWYERIGTTPPNIEQIRKGYE